MTAIWWIIGGGILLAVLIGAFMTGKPIRSLVSSALQGICALAAVNVFSVFSGVTLGVTTFSVTVCSVLGIPGAAALLVLQVLMGGM